MIRFQGMRLPLLALTAALACTTRSALADDVQLAPEDTKKGAQTTFRAANDLFDAGRYEEALTAFRASYEIVHSPNSHLMIARALRELGRLVEAYEELTATVKEARAAGERYERTAEVAQDELDELTARLGTVTFDIVGANEPATVRIGDRTFEGDALAVPHKVEPGEIVAIAETPSGEVAEARATVEAGAEATLTLDLTPAPAEPASAPEPEPGPVEVSSSGIPLRTWAYVAGGVGVAGMAAFGALGAISNSKFSDLEKACPDKRCPPDQQGTIDDGKTFQMIANIGLGVGIAGIGTGVVLFLLSDPPSREKQALSRTPRVSVGLGSVSVRGRF